MARAVFTGMGLISQNKASQSFRRLSCIFPAFTKSPLRQADDAVMIDSSQMGIDEVVAAIREVYEGVCGR